MYIKYLVVFFLLTVQLSALESDDINNVYNNFKQTILTSNGKEASALVSPGTIAQYGKWKQCALTEGDRDYSKDRFVDIMYIFQFRHLFSANELKAMSANDLFIWAVKNKLIKDKIVKGIEIENIKINNNQATATIKKDGQSLPITYHFLKVDGQWKFDLLDSFSIFEQYIEKLQKQTGRTRIELAIFFMEKTYKKQIPLMILAGPLKKTDKVKTGEKDKK